MHIIQYRPHCSTVHCFSFYTLYYQAVVCSLFSHSVELSLASSSFGGIVMSLSSDSSEPLVSSSSNSSFILSRSYFWHPLCSCTKFEVLCNKHKFHSCFVARRFKGYHIVECPGTQSFKLYAKVSFSVPI